MAEPIKSNLSTQPKKPTQGTGYTNIQKVLGANEGNKLGETVQQGITNQATGVREDTNKAGQEFQANVAQSRLDTPESRQAREDAISRIHSGAGINDKDISDFTKYRAGQYSGPTTLSGEENLINKASDVSSSARNLGTAEGRQGVLQQYVGGSSPAYTSGKSALDSLLLGQASGNLKGARQAASGLGRDVYQNIANARELGQSAGQSAQAFGAETGKILEGESTGINQGISGRMQSAAEAEANRKSTMDRIQSILAGTEAASDKRPGAVAGQQLVGGATTGSSNSARALAELESSGLLKPEEIANLRGLTQGTGNLEQDFQKEKLKALINNKKVAIAQGDAPRSVKSALKRYEAALNDPAKFQALLNSDEGQRFLAASGAPGDFSDQELSNIIKNTLGSEDAYGLGQRSAFIQSDEASKLNALAKLSGKTAVENENMDPLAQFRAGSSNVDASKASAIQKLISDINKTQSGNKGATGTPAVNPYGVSSINQRVAEMTRLANLLRGYSQGDTSQATVTKPSVIKS